MSGLAVEARRTSARTTQVLIVDDDPSDAHFTALQVRRASHRTETHTVQSFEEAMFLLGSGRFDIALVDHHLGLQTGLELISLARRHGVECPLVLLSGGCGEEVEMDALDAGATDFLDKSDLQTRALDRALRYNLQRAQELNEIASLKRRLEAIIDGSSDGVWDWNMETGSLFLSPRFRALIGLEAETASSLPEWLSRVHVEDRARLHAALRAEALGAKETLQLEYRVNVNGENRWMYLRGKACRTASGRLERVAGSQTDITAQKEREAEALERAKRDPLTGLGNRTMLHSTIRAAQRRLGECGIGFSVLFFDLDKFKSINDQHGHATGDAALREVASRVSAGLPPGGVAARLGGDEFVVLLNGCASQARAREAAAQIASRLSMPIEVGRKRVRVSASWGVRSVNAPGVSVDQAIADADAAMYAKKDRLGASIQWAHGR